MSNIPLIHPTAIIEPGAQLGTNVRVGPYSYIAADVVIGDDCEIGSHVVIKGPTRLGKANRIFQFASVGEECQDKKYRGEPTQLVMGDRNVVRECVTIHRGTVQDQGLTSIGSDNLFMAYVHIAHDCVVGNNVILANCATLAGHVKIEDWVIVGGMSAFHQFNRVGAHAFVAGGSAVRKDIPPYVMAQNDNAHGINAEGLKRRGFSADQIGALRQAYRILYRQGLTLAEAMPQLAELAEKSVEVAPFVEFLRHAERGIVR